MSRRKWRRGPHILSLDELARQEVVFRLDKPTAQGWFLFWQFRMAVKAIGQNGVVFYAMPAGISTRFSDEDILRAEQRLRTPPTHDGRWHLVNFLNRCDRGHGDIDDVINNYEDEEE